MKKSEEIQARLDKIHHNEDPVNSPSGIVMHSNSQSAENRFELLLEANLAVLKLLEEKARP